MEALSVMPGHSASQTRVKRASVPGIHVLLERGGKDVDGRNKSGHDGECR